MSSDSESDDTGSDMEDFQIDNKKKLKKKQKKVNKKAKKEPKIFKPIITKTKTKASGDKYRKRKNTLVEKAYTLMKNNKVSVSLVFTGQQFSRCIAVAGAGYTLDELSPNVLHFTNYVPENADSEESPMEQLKAAKKMTFGMSPVSIDNLSEVDDFLTDPIGKVLGAVPKKSKEQGTGQDAGPSGDGPSGAGPSGDGPSGAGPSGDGPSGAGSSGDGPSTDKTKEMESSAKVQKAIRAFIRILYKFCAELNASASVIIGLEGSTNIIAAGAGFTLGCIKNRKKQIHNVTYVAPVTQKKYVPGIEVMRSLTMSESIEPEVPKKSKKKKIQEDEVQIVEERLNDQLKETVGLTQKRKKLSLGKKSTDKFQKKMPQPGTIERKKIFDKNTTKSSPFSI